MAHFWFVRAAVVGAVSFLVLGGVASAHEHRNVRALSLVVGWATEPTYSGSVNGVSVEASKGSTPITDAKLSVIVLFGDKNSSTKSASLTLEGSDESPGTYIAPIIPTRPGVYTFHVTGNAGGTKVDSFFTSSETTFDEVKDPTADEFPSKDPTAGQLAQRIANVDSATAKASSEAKRGTIALILGAVGILIGLIALLRRRG